MGALTAPPPVRPPRPSLFVLVLYLVFVLDPSHGGLRDPDDRRRSRHRRKLAHTPR